MSAVDGAPKPRKQARKNIYFAIVAASMAGFALLVYFGDRLGTVGVLLSVLCALVSLVASLAWFASLDELAQRAHYEAWYWGGTLGLMSLPFACFALLLTGNWTNVFIEGLLERIWGQVSVGSAFALGIIVACVPALLGYAIWWVLFWLRNR